MLFRSAPAAEFGAHNRDAGAAERTSGSCNAGRPARSESPKRSSAAGQPRRSSVATVEPARPHGPVARACVLQRWAARSEEHTSELQSLMRISYAVFCLEHKHNIK